MKHRIGIRREDKDPTEKRAPLTPEQVKTLIAEHQVEVVVEPSSNRIFRDEEYRRVGATVSEDLADCNIIFGVKEIPKDRFLPEHTYCFFSHTIKGQAYNMPMLQRMLDLKDTLIDYEKVTDEKGRRLIFFGRFAGYAGMIDTLWAFGQRLGWEGIDTPFKQIRQALNYPSLKAAKASIKAVGEAIQREGLPESLTPLVCGFAGYGQVSQGAQEIYDHLPVETISPTDLAAFVQSGNYSSKKVYKVVFKEEDMVRPVDPKDRFELQDYYQHPEKYRGRFEEYLPYLTLLVNGIYWEPKYPRLVTKQFLRSWYEREKQPRLRVIGDITCDIEGSIECNLEATNSLNPIYVYNPFEEKIAYGCEGVGPVILAVDKLPSELPREASESFGKALLPFVPALARADYTVPFQALEIPPEFKRAVIAHQGQLTPNYEYLREYLERE